jgi:predicted MPP superfamily phosphohydrolase
MKMEFVRIILVVASAGAAGFIVLLLLNRRLMLIPDSWFKVPLIALIIGNLLALFILAGLFLPIGLWAGVLAVIFLCMLAGEVHRIVQRRVCAGSPPVDTVPHKVDLWRPFTTTDVVTHRYRLAIPGWRGPSFRIAHVSDLHMNPSLSIEYYREVFDLVRQAQPDLVFLTGDFVTKAKDVPRLAGILEPLGRCGSYAVLGNHDYWSGADAVRDVIRKAGITLLTDESVRLPMGDGAVQITGCDYPWGKGACLVPPVTDGVLRLVLTHMPDNIYRLSRQSAQVVFSGHHHAGQARLPFFGAIVVPAPYGRRFDHGHFVVGETHLFVTSGVGASMPAVRIYCQPDIFVVDITGKENNDNEC